MPQTWITEHLRWLQVTQKDSQAGKLLDEGWQTLTPTPQLQVQRILLVQRNSIYCTLY